ncbi:MAG: glycosyltransferase [Pseudomonadota bacterium]
MRSAPNLKRRKNTVFIFVNDMNERLERNFNEASKSVSLFVIQIKRESAIINYKIDDQKINQFEFILTARKYLYKKFIINQPSTVFILGWNYSELHTILFLKTIFSFKLVVASDSGFQDYNRSPLVEWVKKTLLKATDIGWAAHSRASSYFSRLLVPKNRLFVGGLDTVDVDHFIQAKNRSSDRELISEQGLKQLITVCRLSPEKNLILLVKAFSEFSRKNKEWRLLIVGDGPLRDKIEALICSLKIQGHVKMVGYMSINELPSYYYQSNVFILASTRDSWGVVVNEAAACSLPLLVSNRAGSSDELVREGENGFVFEPDKQGILNALEKIENRSEDWSEMGRISRTLSLEHGSEQYGKAVVQIVEKAMGLKRRKVPVSSLFLAFAIAAKRRVSEILSSHRS